MVEFTWTALSETVWCHWGLEGSSPGALVSSQNALLRSVLGLGLSSAVERLLQLKNK